MSPGTYEIDGRDVFFKIQTYETNAINDCRFESHQLYADIHCIVSGTEVAGCKSIGSCEILKPYDASLDVALWEPSAENARVILQQGTFLIAFPTEVHFTGGMYKGKDSVKKVLMKV